MDHEPEFSIGVVSRIVGINIATLRKWESRYNVVQPHRTIGNRRLYSHSHIDRLSLMKQLVDKGESIGSIAGLSNEILRKRVEFHGHKKISHFSQNEVRTKAIVFGVTLPYIIESSEIGANAIDIINVHSDWHEFESDTNISNAELMVMEFPVIFVDTVSDIQTILRKNESAVALIVYGYAARNLIKNLKTSSRVYLCPATGHPETINNALVSCASKFVFSTPNQATEESKRQARQSRFDSAKLAQIANLTQTPIRCECPRHLATLITNLKAFEEYSKGCESRHDDDAALHAHLASETARARETMENLLQKIIEEEEKIEIKN